MAVDDWMQREREAVIEAERTAELRRQREAFAGAIQWEAAFFGWLAAIGLAAVLVAMVIGAGAAVGITELDSGSEQRTRALSLVGGVLLVVVLAIAYLAGGYVAGRMARFDGWRQGLGVWTVGLAMILAFALTAWLAGGEINPLEALDLPRIPVDEGGLTRGGAIALVATAAVTLAAALAGGVFGERFHRAIDLAGREPAGGQRAEPTGPAEAEADEASTQADKEEGG